MNFTKFSIKFKIKSNTASSNACSNIKLSTNKKAETSMAETQEGSYSVEHVETKVETH